jgi:hypothetical protein
MIWFSKKGSFIGLLELKCISFRISKNFAFELNFLYLIRRFSDGITFFNLNFDSDFYKGDHNPQFGIKIMFFNVMILDIRIYNIHHVEDEKIKDLMIKCPNCKNSINVRLE